MQPTAIVPGGPEDQPPAGRADTAAAAPWGTALTTLAVAAALVAATTMLQGQWSERWVKRDVAASLTRDAVILERVFPTRFGDWEMEIELESDPKEMQAAGAVGHVSRVFRNVRSGARVSAFVVCATPYDASIHTPDRCYPGAGFEVAESEHRQTVPLADGRAGETWTGTFQKKEQTIRVFWTYGGHGQWLAPQIARIDLAGMDAVYKLYAVVDESRKTGGQAMAQAVDFLSELLPKLDEAVAAARAAESPADGAAEAARSEREMPPVRG